MATFADLPTELVDMIFERVRDSTSLFPFLISRRTHKSALLAIYERITIRLDKADALISAMWWPNVSHAVARVRELRIDFATAVGSAISDEGQILEHAASKVKALLLLAPRAEFLELLGVQHNYYQRIDHSGLKRISIQQESPGLSSAGRNKRAAFVNLEIVGRSHLQSLTVRAGMLGLRADSTAHSLQRLHLDGDCMLFSQDRVGGIYTSQGPMLPFESLQDVTLIPGRQGENSQKTVPLLRRLLQKLLKSKNTLHTLSLLCDSNYIGSFIAADTVDFTEYIALRKLLISARPVGPLNRGISQDGNRLRINSTTIQTVEFVVRDAVASLEALLEFVYDFIHDNCGDKTSTPFLSSIVISVSLDCLEALREKRPPLCWPNPSRRVQFFHEVIEFSDGRVLWRPNNDHSRTVAALRSLVTEHEASLTNIGKQHGVTIDIGDIKKALAWKDELALETERMIM